VVATYDSTTGKPGGELRVDVYLDGSGAKQLFAELQKQRSAIELEMGESMTWYNPPETRMSRIYIRRSADVGNREEWPEYREWFKAKLEAIARVFVQRVRKLSE
jgi:hypothetical protein